MTGSLATGWTRGGDVNAGPDDRLVSLITPNNVHSQRVAKRLGANLPKPSRLQIQNEQLWSGDILPRLDAGLGGARRCEDGAR
jgi:hypothetical protein